MVLRPVYHSQEANMQFPYQEPVPSEGGTWQTPYGQPTSQNEPYVGDERFGSNHTSTYYQTDGPYATAGENSTYYGGQSQAPTFDRGYNNQAAAVPFQEQYSEAPGYSQVPQAPYVYDQAEVNAPPPQAVYQGHEGAQSIKQEDRNDVYAQQHQSTQYPPDPAHSVPDATEQDRGVMGALAGAAAGGYAGHKMHHGFLGALGGAYAGHKLEDAYKDHKKQSKPPTQMPGAPLQQHNQVPARHGNFSASSADITLDKDYDLIASCKNIKGHKKLSAISLNAVITNDDGHFRWVAPGIGVGNFGASARHVQLVNGGRTLEAELRCCNGQWRKDSIRLDERIENSDGDLRMT